MRDIFLLDFGNARYGVWKDEVLAVKEIQTLHRVPLSPACIAGMSILDGRMVTLADLSVCIGLPPLTRERSGRILILSEQEKLTGFVVEGGITPVTVPPGAIFPMPDYLKSPVIDACVSYQSELIPVINITALYNRVQKSDREPPVPGFEVRRAEPSDIFSVGSIRVFECGGELFAASAEGTEAAVEPGRVARLALVPQYVPGIAFHRGSVLPLIHLAQRMKLAEKGSARVMLTARVGGDLFGFLIDRDEGMVSGSGFAIKALPSIARSSWMQAGAVVRGEILPLIDLGAIAAVTPEGAGEKPVSGRYSADSRFPSIFGIYDVEVVEFSLLGARHAVPRSEVEATMPFRPYRQVPNVQPIVIGLAEHEGELLPVLDLAMCFGRRSLATPEWRMILVRNGDFRALVITEAVFGDRPLAVENQRGVPIHVPHRVVYGCYPDAATVRLILNVEALTVHFDRSLVKELLPALSQEMRHAPAEIVPSLLESEESAAHARPQAVEAQAAPVETAGPGAVPETAGSAATVAFSGTSSEPSPEGESNLEGSGSAVESASIHAEETAVGDMRTPALPAAGMPAQDMPPQPEVKAEPVSPSAGAMESTLGTESYLVPETQPGPRPRSGSAGTDQPVQSASREDAGPLPASGEDLKPEKETAGAPEETAHDPNDSQGATAGMESAPEGETRGEAPVGEVAEPRETREEASSLSEAAVRSDQAVPASSRRETQASATSGPEQQEPVPLMSLPGSKPAPAVLREEIVPASPGAGPSAGAGAVRKEERSAPVSAQPVTGREPGEREAGMIPPRGEYAETPSVSAWKRRLAYGIAGALLIGILYLSGVFERPTGDRTVTVKETRAGKDVPGASPPEKAVQEKAGPVKPAAPPPVSGVYEVKKGDTLWAISKRFTGNPYNYPRMAKENGIEDPDLIFPGQTIRLKK